MQFGRDIAQPLQRMVARQAARRGQQLAIGLQVRQVLHDSGAFGKQRAVIQLQRRNLTFRVDLQIVFAAFGHFFRQVDINLSEIEIAFAQNDMGRKGTGASFTEEFHTMLLVACGGKDHPTARPGKCQCGGNKKAVAGTAFSLHALNQLWLSAACFAAASRSTVIRFSSGAVSSIRTAITPVTMPICLNTSL